MLSFLHRELRQWPEVFKGETPQFSYAFEDFGTCIAFEAAGHLYGWERVYFFSVMKWIALKIGNKTARFNKDVVGDYKFSEPVAYMTYDGFENWPILPMTVREARRLPKSVRWCATDKLGVYLDEHTNESLIIACALEKDFAAQLQREMAKIGPWPEDRSGKAYTRHLKRYGQIKAKIAKPEIRRVLPFVRNELKRLNALWESQGHETA